MNKEDVEEVTLEELAESNLTDEQIGEIIIHSLEEEKERSDTYYLTIMVLIQKLGGSLVVKEEEIDTISHFYDLNSIVDNEKKEVSFELIPRTTVQ